MRDEVRAGFAIPRRAVRAPNRDVRPVAPAVRAASAELHYPRHEHRVCTPMPAPTPTTTPPQAHAADGAARARQGGHPTD